MLVLGGGNAVGACHGGAVSALETTGVRSCRAAGSSIGAIMAALVAGNLPSRRIGVVRKSYASASIREKAAA